MPDAAAGITHEVDVVVSGADQRILALGEARVGARPGSGEVERLRRIRRLLQARGHAAGEARLGFFSAAGFAAGLGGADREELVLVDLDRLYAGS